MIIYLNKEKDMIDHRSYDQHNLSSCEIKAWKRPRIARDSLRPMTSVLPVQCFLNWAIKLQVGLMA